MFKYLLFGIPGWVARTVLITILITSGVMLGYAAYHDAPTFDESAHIPAGYANVHELDYRLNPEHPPLVKAIAAFPLLALNLNFPTHLAAWQTDVNGQWVMGGNFFYNSGNDAALLVRTARLGPILITLLFILVVYWWSSRLMGKMLALIPTFLIAWSPNILAHGHLVTTDIGAALGITLATMMFIQFLFFPSRKHLLFAGLAFGLAQLLKFSAVLLLPYFLVLIFVFWLASIARDWDATDAKARFKRFFIRGLRYLKSTVVIFILGYVLVVYPVYFLFTIHYPGDRQARDTEVILQSFANGTTPAGQACSGLRCLADVTIKAAHNRALQPFAEYSLGVLTAFQRSQGGNANYFLGKVSGSGTSTYFPIVYLLKEPVPVLLIILIGLITAIYAAWNSLRNKPDATGLVHITPFRSRIAELAGSETAFSVFAMLFFVALYWYTSITSPLNIGLRHLIPTFAFTYILATMAWKRWIAPPVAGGSSALTGSNAMLAGVLSRFSTLPQMIGRGVTFGVLIFLFALSTLVATPDFISYYNVLAGRTWNGYRYATDSNYDWGQDLYRLKEFVDEHPEIDRIAVDYFGGGSPAYTLGAKEENWWSSRGNPAESGIHWFAVSVNTLEGSIQPTKGFYERKPEDQFPWLVSSRESDPGIGGLPRPDFRAGPSIFIYQL